MLRSELVVMFLLTYYAAQKMASRVRTTTVHCASMLARGPIYAYPLYRQRTNAFHVGNIQKLCILVTTMIG